jgi:hypothetical protein
MMRLLFIRNVTIVEFSEIVVLFKVLSWHLSRETEENHEELYSGLGGVTTETQSNHVMNTS